MGITFAPLTTHELPLLHRWLNAPHVSPWFGDGHTYDETLEEFLPRIEGREASRAYVASLDGRPVGLFQRERMGDEPDFMRAYEVTDPESVNCDVLVGEPDCAHRGLGVELLREFLAREVFGDPRCTACVIDPVVDNTIAIRAYEKLGFRFVRALADDGDGNALYLMELRRDELGVERASAQGFFVRPGREHELTVAQSIDDDACALYVEAGLVFDVASRPSFFASEMARWSEALGAKRLLFACAPGGEPVGFIALTRVDGLPFVQQLSVRREWMRRGVGRALLERAKRWSVRSGELWLTTYDHMPWNLAYYERLGFESVEEAQWGAELGAIVGEERLALPAPEHRAVMRFRHDARRTERER